MEIRSRMQMRIVIFLVIYVGCRLGKASRSKRKTLRKRRLNRTASGCRALLLASRTEISNLRLDRVDHQLLYDVVALLWLPASDILHFPNFVSFMLIEDCVIFHRSRLGRVAIHCQTKKEKERKQKKKIPRRHSVRSFPVWIHVKVPGSGSPVGHVRTRPSSKSNLQVSRVSNRWNGSQVNGKQRPETKSSSILWCSVDNNNESKRKFTDPWRVSQTRNPFFLPSLFCRSRWVGLMLCVVDNFVVCPSIINLYFSLCRENTYRYRVFFFFLPFPFSIESVEKRWLVLLEETIAT